MVLVKHGIHGVLFAITESSKSALDKLAFDHAPLFLLVHWVLSSEVGCLMQL
jgi:hypothetical protein